jgi:4-hydroxy-3-polyprenylbenzoate decarboxylase
MSTERKPVAFGDMRNWMKALKSAGELREIDAEVDWDVELGTVTRIAQGPGTGPALLFSNIKDYHKNNTRCGAVFTGGLGSYRRVAMMMGLSPDSHPRELVKIGRNIMEGRVPPRVVESGPCKENILKGKDINLYDFPVPQWNRVDGGRYILTYGGVVTKDPTTGVMNIGVYRGMVSAKDRIPILMWRAQHIGQHATAWQNGGSSEMPIAVAIGWEPSLAFTGGSPVPKGV